MYIICISLISITQLPVPDTYVQKLGLFISATQLLPRTDSLQSSCLRAWDQDL